MPLPLSRTPHVTFLLTYHGFLSSFPSFRSLFRHVQAVTASVRGPVAEAERRLRAFPMEFAVGSASSKISGMEYREVPHVLAVDDNLVDRKIIETLLTNSACKVTTAENGMRALEYLGLRDDGQNSTTTASKVNLIITDYCMPGMTGYELLKKIKGSSYLKEVPVVVVSSENVPTRINKCLEEGAQMFMLKPLKQADVKKLRCHLMNFRS